MSHLSQKRKPDCSVTTENKHSSLDTDIARFSAIAQSIHPAASLNTALWVCCGCSDTHCCADCLLAERSIKSCFQLQLLLTEVVL